jgi:formylglycine-generating enzyme required for sulfatase activity
MRWLFFIYISAVLFWSHGGESIVHLRNGKEFKGELVNSEVTIHAPYGSITLKSESIAEVHFASRFDTDIVLTSIGNRFSGFIEDALMFKAAGGNTISLRRFEIESLRIRAFDLAKASQFLVLLNGDLLSGEFTVPELVLTNAAGAVTLESKSIDSVWFTKNEDAVDVQLTDGKQVRAHFSSPTVHLRLDSGGELDISRELLKTIYAQATIPPEVVRLADASVGTNSVSKSPPPERMIWIAPGAVVLGSPLNERGRNSDEDPRTHVTISRGYWIGKYEVTQGEYLAVMGDNPSTFQGDTNRPVEKVSWHDANDYCVRLTEIAREKGTLPSGYVYRLPTEAEWEYACRGGTTSRFSFGEDPEERALRDFAWFAGNSGWTTHPVGQLKPNPWGLYDMHGNVLEWCAGIWSQSYPGGQVPGYNGPSEGWLRVARGGSWLYGGPFARSANRDDYGAGNRCSDLGFRIVLASPL